MWFGTTQIGYDYPCHPRHVDYCQKKQTAKPLGEPIAFPNSIYSRPACLPFVDTESYKLRVWRPLPPSYSWIQTRFPKIRIHVLTRSAEAPFGRFHVNESRRGVRYRKPGEAWRCSSQVASETDGCKMLNSDLFQGQKGTIWNTGSTHDRRIMKIPCLLR